MISRSILSLILVSISFLTLATEKNTIKNPIKYNQKIKKTLDFIAAQKKFIEKEQTELKAKYQAIKKDLKQIMPENYVKIKAMTQTTINKVLESKQCIAYNNYMSDFLFNLIVKGNLQANEIPPIAPDRTLSIKINKLIKEFFDSNLFNSRTVINFLEIYLALKINSLATDHLIRKLNFYSDELAGKLIAIQNNEQ